jgi:TPR repeat protein
MSIFNLWYRFRLRGLKVKAEAGDAVAQRELGVYYSNGMGVDVDMTEAVRWYQKAAEQGEVGAWLAMGAFTFAGVGVTQDKAVGYAWLNLALVFEEPGKRAVVESQMTSEEVARGRELAKEHSLKYFPLYLAKAKARGVIS